MVRNATSTASRAPKRTARGGVAKARARTGGGKAAKTVADSLFWQGPLDPSNYARPWFKRSGLAAKVGEALASARIPAGGESKVLVPLSRRLLAEGREAIKARFLKDNDGPLYVGSYALLMDSLVSNLFKRVLGGDAARLALVATGGYGRGGLAPHSDIDLLFLTTVQPGKATTRKIETLLYILWDSGLEVSQAIRSMRQQLRAVDEDITIRTALLEARFLAGDRAMFDELMERFDNEVVADSGGEFIALKLKERDARHARNGDHRYMVEPNIKEGKGGLRDLHTLYWIARYAYRVGSIDEMIERGVLSVREAREFSNAERFLVTVRCHLHLRANREDDRLTFDAQMDIAPALGFRKGKGSSAVERFMRRYYLAAKAVGNLTRIFCAAFAADFNPATREDMPQLPANLVPEPFSIGAGRLHLPPAFHFRDRPELMMGMFEIAQETGLDIHPDALRKLHASLGLVDDAYRRNRGANASFLAILASRRSPERVLRLMNESGFIGKFMPDFGRIVALMQFDMYHSFTVDEHTIHAVGILNSIEEGRLAEIAPVATAAAREINQRRELYVAMLLHDIAKGRGGDHSALGEKVARQVCPRLGLERESTETVAWLVRNHLLMSETAFRYDLNDPSTIDGFAEAVQSPERLNLLLILTVADIRAVGPNVWNDWKAALMRTLYARTMAVLRGEDPAGELRQIETQAKSRLREALARRWSAKRADEHIELFYDSYWTGFDHETHLRHAAMFKEHAKRGSPISVSLTPDRRRNATELVVITVDDAGLFSRIAGGVAALGASIVDARIITRKDGLTLDSLWLQDRDRKAITAPAELGTLRKGLEQALSGLLDIQAATDRRARQTPSRIRRITAPTRVLASNAASKTHTVLEINGKDAPGLLYKLTGRMAELGLQIQMASVSTYGNRVVDVFYVKDAFGLKIENEERLERIRRELAEVLEESDPAGVAAA